MSYYRIMQMTTSPLVVLLLVMLSLSSIIHSTNASSNHMNPNNNNNHNHNHHDYCLNRQISIDPNLDTVQIEGETELFNFYHSITDTAVVNNDSNDNHDNHDDDDEEDIAMFNVSPYYHQQLHQQHQQQRYNHQNYNQMQQRQSQNSFISMGECSFMSYLQDKINWDDVDFDDDDEDDDDEDDNDGHSSMLSNASIRRRIAVGAGATPSSDSSYYYYGQGGQRSSYNKNYYVRNRNTNFQHSIPSLSKNIHCRLQNNSNNNSYNLNSRSPSSLNSILKVRGGANTAATATADEFAKRLLAAAAVTVLYEGIIGHIFEFLKIGMQTAPVGTTYMSIMRRITDEKGIAGAWDGFVPWGVVQAIFKGGVFGLALSMAKTYLSPLAEKGILPEKAVATLCGGIAGGVQGFVLSPLLLLKTRVMTNPVFRENMTLLKTTYLSLTIGLEVARNEGILALMKGSDIFAVKRVFDWSTRYYFSEVFKMMMLKYGAGVNGVLSPAEKIIASLLAGTVSTFMTLPLDVIVAKAQDAKKAGVKVSALETFLQDYKQGGWKGLYDANMMGFEVRLVHVCCTTVVMQ
eukprot:CAMPEP_0203668082 /NCGR_PEP_ID=MMETSP0090-20130426/4791_1 /ASSEMBLY_ACC=CAM_ASM_001088 /TAXON_ID=426623 /ORGANISM="Chaetoceros affinis, Strain CCMP159" /LENGTH=573 /DNA_ID=CAMNT_0050532425 /DNA_START=156 /DNA_END=1874 /DNA_ORIENTATION=+